MTSCSLAVIPHSGHADQWVRLPAWGFLLVFYGNQGPRMHRFDSMGQTDRRTVGWITALSPPWGVGTKAYYFEAQAVAVRHCMPK